jgi:hypothetical protein
MADPSKDRPTPPPSVAIKTAQALRRAAAKFKFDPEAVKKFALRYAVRSMREIAGVTNQGATRAVKQAIDLMVQKSVAEIESFVTSGTAKLGIELTATEHATLAKQLLGLDQGRINATLQYRETLVKAGMNRASVDKAVAKMVKEKLASRAAVIGRTETATALNEGKLQGWQQAIKKGKLSPKSYKVIATAADDRVCPICRQQAGKRIPILTKAGTPRQFQIGNVVRYSAGVPTVWGQRWVKRPPFHVSCRCTMYLIKG